MVNLSNHTLWTSLLSVAFLAWSVAGCGSSSPAASTTGMTMDEMLDETDSIVLATYGDRRVTMAEFEHQFARSAGTPQIEQEDSAEAYRDFLERYVNFRLKVAAAEEAGMAEQSAVLEEIESYRSRLARPYLLDEEVLDPIVRTIYERRQQIVDVSHILLSIPAEPAPEDTLAVYRRLASIRDSALQGTDFGDLALRHSEDPSASGDENARGHRGRLGYFTGGHLVEPFESIAYATPVGEISPVFRTDFGYHVLTVHDRVAAPGNRRISHIMLRPEPAAEDTVRVRALLTRMKSQLAGGADFSELVSQYSQDEPSRSRGGDLGTVEYISQLPEAFRDAAFQLEEIGAVSDVVETAYGFHLLKLTGRAEPPTYEASYEELKSMASRLPRTQEAEADLARDVLARRGGRVDTSVALRAFEGLAPDSVLYLLSGGASSGALPQDTFFVIGDTSFTVRHLASAVTQGTVGAAQSTPRLVERLVGAFVTHAVIDLEARSLEDRNPEFRRLMNEFRDGLVLFEFMEDSVWTAAAQDTAALRAHYEAHASSYRFPDRTRVVSLTSPSDSLLRAVGAALDRGTTVAELVATYARDAGPELRADTAMVADSTQTIHEIALDLTEGGRTDVLPHRGGYVLLMNGGAEEARTKSFEEARATILSEYQEIVENRLIERLRGRYHVRTFPERLVSAYGTPDQETRSEDQ